MNNQERINIASLALSTVAVCCIVTKHYLVAQTEPAAPSHAIEEHAEPLDNLQEATLDVYHPVSTNSLTIIKRSAYHLGYNTNRLVADWCTYILNNYGGTAPHRPGNFRKDQGVSPNAYTHTGYDRGHLAPSYGIGACYGAEAQRETFYMSNVAPQLPGLNRAQWRQLESLAARTYAQSYGRVLVITGPIYTNAPSSTNGVAIPDAFYKIIYDEIQNGDESDIRGQAFLMHQDAGDVVTLRQALVSIDHVEALTGLDFMPSSKGEQEVERTTPAAIWIDHALSTAARILDTQ